MVLTLSSCSNSSANNQQKSSPSDIGGSLSSSALTSSSASGTQANSSSAQASSPASGTQKSSGSAQASALPPSANSKAGYCAYTGNWVNSEQKGTIEKNGGTGMTLSVKSNGDITGSITTVSSNLSHIAEVDFKGTIKNNIFKTNFQDDNWGHSGTVTLKFNGSEINCTIVLNSAQQSMWSIKSGTIKFIRQKK